MSSFIRVGLVSLDGSLWGERRVVLVLGVPQVRGSGQCLRVGGNVCNYCREAGH